MALKMLGQSCMLLYHWVASKSKSKSTWSFTFTQIYSREQTEIIPAKTNKSSSSPKCLLLFSPRPQEKKYIKSPSLRKTSIKTKYTTKPKHQTSIKVCVHKFHYETFWKWDLSYSIHWLPAVKLTVNTHPVCPGQNRCLLFALKQHTALETWYTRALSSATVSSQQTRLGKSLCWK